MLRARIITAAVLIALLLAIILLLPPWTTVAALTLVVLAGAWEWSAFLKPVGAGMRVGYLLLIGALLPLAWWGSTGPVGRLAVPAAAVAWWLVALAWVAFAPGRTARWSAALAGALALVPAWLALVRLRLDLARGAQWLLFVLALVWVADIGAYFAGRSFGRRRLAPQVSPGKTWEGVLGGALSSAVLASFGGGWFGLPRMVFVPLCLVAVAFSVVGDLTESLLKRFAGLKDSGTLFPGHGGVMDRIDSVTGAAPVIFFGLLALGVTR
ncbi:MAG TPA: phosphatidate cytidylyltransferase [Steroidobacteraceae bacterium]|nr:phosphatidate cytidylyltransferase [Steroidobacteraceae bacterium]